MERLPESSLDLIAELDKIFPNRYPAITDTERTIWFDAGARSVIDMLMTLRGQTLKRRKLLPTDTQHEDDE